MKNSSKSCPTKSPAKAAKKAARNNDKPTGDMIAILKPRTKRIKVTAMMTASGKAPKKMSPAMIPKASQPAKKADSPPKTMKNGYESNDESSNDDSSDNSCDV